MTFDVYLEDILWDREVDGDLDEVTYLPGALVFEGVKAEDADEAIDTALDNASNLTGFCIIDSNPLVDLVGGY